MDAHSNDSATPIALTWAMTSVEQGKRARIGKVWSPEGKWDVTDGVKGEAYFFGRKIYSGLEAVAADVSARSRDGGFAPVAGALRPRLAPLGKHRRAKENFVDEPCWLFALDFDGLKPAKPGTRLDRPDDFGKAALDEALKRLPPAFDADCLCYATSSTGLPVNAKGEPANGRAWFRLVFLLSRPLTFAEQKQIVRALKQLPGLECLDEAIYVLAQFSFVTRPQFPAGMADPIKEPALLCEGARPSVDVDALLKEVIVEPAPERPDKQRSPGTGAEERLLHVDPAIRYELIERLVAAIPNDIEEHGGDWLSVAHAIKGASGDPYWGLDLWLEFCARWTKGSGDPDENLRVWEFVYPKDGRAGIGTLLRLAEKAGTPEAIDAVAAIRQAQKQWAFKDPPDDLPDADENDEEDDDEALLARRAPTIGSRAFYGPLDRIVTETTRESEATKVGVAAQVMAHVSLTLRPFYNPMGDAKVPFNIYAVQVGPSGRGRKGTSAAIADAFLGPALLRLAAQVQARIAFPDEVEDIHAAAEAEVEETARRLSWTKEVSEDREAEIEARLAMLRDDDATAVREIAARKAGLKAKARAYRTVREHERLIAAAQARRDDIARRIAADEAELIEVKDALKDRGAALSRAQAAYDTAQAKLDRLSPPLPPAPWLTLFASLAEGPVTARGVSTGEGLIELIRDPGRKQGLRGPIDDPGVANKCLFLNLDELGSVLAVIMRLGATLSTTLRTMWDCSVTELLNKNSPTRCKEPYLVLSASITPGELMGRLFDKHDAASSADNGFANRFLFLWVKRDKLKARPLATPGLDAMMDEIAGNIFSVYEALKPDGAFRSTPIDFSRAAHARYVREYPRIANLNAAGRRAAKLIERLPVYLRRIAAILAVMNGEHEISEGALEAAIAWIEYAAGTVNAIATTAADRKRTKILADDGETILTALKALGSDGKPVGSREVQRKTHLDKERFDAAIVELMQQGPTPITVLEEAYTSGHGTRRTRALLALNGLATAEDEI